MTHPSAFAIPPAWRMVLSDLGLRSEDVLRRAGLPANLFSQESPKLDAPAYFRLWRALEEEDGGPALPLRVAEVLSSAGFDPPLFAALTSPDLNVAFERLSRFKKLVGPMTLTVDRGADATTIEIACLDVTEPMPAVLVAMELVFLVRLARLATREPIRPVTVSAPVELEPREQYAAFFGVPVRPGGAVSVVFSAVDATRPFLTASDAMWRFFEPELQRRLSALDAQATTKDAVRAALFELLPSGRSSIDHAAAALGLTPRTLQRRLEREGTRFRTVLDQTREKLSLHYLRRTHMTAAEISFMLGYEDPNSFFRAFRQWTGQTPERARSALSEAGRT